MYRGNYLEENYGAHTLRKTRGYIQRTKYWMGSEIVCKWFNHSSPAVTIWKLHTRQIKQLQLLAGISKQIKLKFRDFSEMESISEPHGSFFKYPHRYMDCCGVTNNLIVGGFKNS